MLSPSFVGLHTGQAVTLPEYLFRVLVSLLAVAGSGVVIYGGLRVIDLVSSAVGGRERVDETEP